MTNTAAMFWGPTYQKRYPNGSGNGDECCFCGKPTDGALMVECPFDNLGWFAIGPDCAKRAEAAGLTVEVW